MDDFNFSRIEKGILYSSSCNHSGFAFYVLHVFWITTHIAPVIEGVSLGIPVNISDWDGMKIGIIMLCKNHS